MKRGASKRVVSGVDLRDKKCRWCGRPAEARYRGEWICGECLNPEPSKEYLRIERERANGSWGGVSRDTWKMP